MSYLWRSDNSEFCRAVAGLLARGLDVVSFPSVRFAASTAAQCVAIGPLHLRVQLYIPMFGT